MVRHHDTYLLLNGITKYFSKKNWLGRFTINMYNNSRLSLRLDYINIYEIKLDYSFHAIFSRG